MFPVVDDDNDNEMRRKTHTSVNTSLRTTRGLGLRPESTDCMPRQKKMRENECRTSLGFACRATTRRIKVHRGCKQGGDAREGRTGTTTREEEEATKRRSDGDRFSVSVFAHTRYFFFLPDSQYLLAFLSAGPAVAVGVEGRDHRITGGSGWVRA